MCAFEEVIAFLPPSLRLRASALPRPLWDKVEEFRLRAGRIPTVSLEGDELPLPGEGKLTRRELELTVEIVTRASAHTALEAARRGYLPLRGGHRLGLCGSVWTEEGQVRNLRSLSSLNLRVAHAIPGCGATVLRTLVVDGEFPNTLILAPPGGGKTTLLRDLVRLLSDGLVLRPLRVGLCDERGEVAALWEGEPQFDVGERTDILEGCPKAQALLMLLRTMTPQVLACDELTDPEDLAALEHCTNCGVGLLATVHAGSVEELAQKPLYRALLERRLFARAVVLRRGEGRSFRVEDLPC